MPENHQDPVYTASCLAQLQTLKTIKATIVFGSEDSNNDQNSQAENTFRSTTSVDVVMRFGLWTDIVDTSSDALMYEDTNIFYFGKNETQEKYQFLIQRVFDFVSALHENGYFEDKSNKHNPKDSRNSRWYDYPDHVLDLLWGGVSNYTDPSPEKMTEFVHLLNIAGHLKISTVTEGIAEIFAKLCKDRSPDQILQMFGIAGGMTPDMEAQIVKDYPFLA